MFDAALEWSAPLSVASVMLPFYPRARPELGGRPDYVDIVSVHDQHAAKHRRRCSAGLVPGSSGMRWRRRGKAAFRSKGSAPARGHRPPANEAIGGLQRGLQLPNSLSRVCSPVDDGAIDKTGGFFQVSRPAAKPAKKKG